MKILHKDRGGSLLELIKKRVSRNVISLPTEVADELQLNAMYTERPSSIVEAVFRGSVFRGSVKKNKFYFSTPVFSDDKTQILFFYDKLIPSTAVLSRHLELTQ